jgi:hypothetical protein
VCGRILCIKHSEMNGFLMYDPALPARGPYWSIDEDGDASDDWRVSNSLWSIEASTVEWGGGPLKATLGTSDTDRTKQKGYRLEHINTGLYLTLVPAPKDAAATTAAVGPKLTMSEQFTSDKALWYFRFKNEGGDAEEGQHAHLDYASTTPVYLQHSSGVWLSRLTAEGDDVVAALGMAAAAGGDAGVEKGIWNGGAQLACRKELNFTDSIVVLDVDQGAMSEIACLLKLMKPIDFFLAEEKVRGAGYDIINTDTPELQAAIEGVDKAERERGGLGPLQFMANLNPLQAVTNMSGIDPMQSISNLNPLRGFEDVNPNRVADKVSITIALLRKNVVADVPGSKRQLNRFLGSVLRSRMQTLLARRKADCSNLRSKRSELIRCLRQIRKWLAPSEATAPRRWHQNTLREQGALGVLDSLLRTLVDAGFVLVDSSAHSGSLRETSALLASVYFTEIGGLLFDILRLACVGNLANAAALRGSVPVYDLYLGTVFDAAGLLHEIFKNREITNSFREEDILRYALLMCQHRRPVFVRLIRNLLASDGRPVPTNQRLVASLLFTEMPEALPEMQVVLPDRPGQYSRILLRRHVEHGGYKSPSKGASDQSETGEWIDLETFIDSFTETCAKSVASMTDDELVVVYYSEILELLRDLCRKRCAEAIGLVSRNGRMQLDYVSVLQTMQSEKVPFQIRGRMCELMVALYVDCEPQKYRSLIPEVRLIVCESAGSEVGPHSQASGRYSIQFERLELLKVAVMDHLVAFAKDSLEFHAGLKIALLKQFCDVVIMLLTFGLFLSPAGPKTTSEDLHCLIRAVLANVNGATLYDSDNTDSIKNEENSVLSSSTDLQNPETRNCANLKDGSEVDEHRMKSDVLGLMGKIFELVFDIRSGSRLEMLVNMYEKHDRSVGRNVSISDTEYPLVLSEMKNQICCPDVGDCSGELITESIFRLSKVQMNPRLQALSLRLLLRQLAPIKETISISQTLLLVDDELSVMCCNQLRESIGLVRGCFEDCCPSSLQQDTIAILSENLQVISELLDAEKYGSYMVKECQKYLLMDKFHLVARDILKIPIGLKPSGKGLERAESSAMLELFVRCYEFLRSFCRNNLQNQEELFLLVPEFLDHIGIDGLNATECITASIRGNAAVCSRVPEKMLRFFLMAIVKYGKRARWLRILLVCMAGDGTHIDHSQDIVLRNLEEMAEIILELDGHQGDGTLDTDSKQEDADSSNMNGRMPGQSGDPQKSSTPTKDSKIGPDRGTPLLKSKDMVQTNTDANGTENNTPAKPLKRKETSKLLAREGTATRHQLMMQREHEKQDSFLEYHIICLETLAKCAEGLDQGRKSKCQTFFSFDEVLESILDLHLSPKPDNLPKVSQDVLRYIRTGIIQKFYMPRDDVDNFFCLGFVNFLAHVYASSSHPKTLQTFFRDDNRWYTYEKKLPIEKWRNQTSLMDHFVEEIDSLRSSVIQYQRSGKTKIRKLSALRAMPKEVYPIEYHWTYVFGAVIPCLEKYYSNQHLAALQSIEQSKYFARRKLYASRIASAVRDLVGARKLDAEDTKTCKNLFARIAAISAETGPELQIVTDGGDAKPEDAEVWMNASWTKFIRDLSSNGEMAEACHSKSGITSFCELIAVREKGDFIKSIVHVLTLLASELSGSGDQLCQTLLEALVELLATGKATHHEYLKSGVLQTAIRLVSHPNEHIVLHSVHLTWEIMSACKAEAHEAAEAVLISSEGPQFMRSCRTCIKMFFDHMKTSNKHRKRRASGLDVSDALELQVSARAERYATLACELLEIIERVSRQNPQVQDSLRECEVLNAIVDFMVEVERNVLSEINKKNSMFVLMLAKGFLVLVASLSGPNQHNRLAITYTNVLSMIDRLFAKLSYLNSDDLMHDHLTATIRTASIIFLRVLFELPSDAVVGKRILETIDWALFFKSWAQSKDLLDHLMKELGLADSSELILSTPGYRAPNIDDYSLEIRSIGEGLTASGEEASAKRAAALRQIAVNILNEGFLMAMILNSATDEGLFGPDMTGPLKQQQELVQLLQSEAHKGFEFYTDRLVSVEINRGGALERLQFRLPEDCVTLKSDPRFLHRISEAIFQDLSTESDEARQTSLLERMVAFSDDLQCESELSGGPHKWVMAIHPWCVPGRFSTPHPPATPPPR